MKILLDTNVVLDVLLDRDPHAEWSAKLFDLVEKKQIQGVLCATTLTTIYYISAKTKDRDRALNDVRDLLAIFEIAPVDYDVFSQALSLDFDDFEDAIIHEAARRANVAIIITRDKSGFSKSEIGIFSPADYVKQQTPSS